jgi:peptidoglycan hydrolase-like protein with peptidoglycan-binding domain
MYVKIEIDDKAMKIGDSSLSSFTNILDSAVSKAIKTAQRNVGRQVYGDGNGILCKIPAAMDAAGLSFTVDNRNFLVIGMIVDIYAANEASVATGREITNIVNGTGRTATVTVSGDNFQAAANAFLTVQGSYEAELTGLSLLINKNNTIYGVDRANNGWLDSVIYDLSSASGITDEVILEAILEADHKGGTINYIAVSTDVYLAYSRYLSLQKRNVNTMQLKGGFSGITFNYAGRDIPIVQSQYVPANTLYGFVLDSFTIQQLGEWDSANMSSGIGGSLIPSTTSAAYSTWWAKYSELLCDNPGWQMAIINIKTN